MIERLYTLNELSELTGAPLPRLRALLYYGTLKPRAIMRRGFLFDRKTVIAGLVAGPDWDGSIPEGPAPELNGQ